LEPIPPPEELPVELLVDEEVEPPVDVPCELLVVELAGVEPVELPVEVATELLVELWVEPVDPPVEVATELLPEELLELPVPLPVPVDVPLEPELPDELELPDEPEQADARARAARPGTMKRCRIVIGSSPSCWKGAFSTNRRRRARQFPSNGAAHPWGRQDPGAGIATAKSCGGLRRRRRGTRDASCSWQRLLPRTRLRCAPCPAEPSSLPLSLRWPRQAVM
jgi:hypothetical protein